MSQSDLLPPTPSIPADVYALLCVLEVLQPLAVAVELFLEDRVLMCTSPFVVFEPAGAFQSLEVQPASESNANSIHDEMRLDMNLRNKRKQN